MSFESFCNKDYVCSSLLKPIFSYHNSTSIKLCINSETYGTFVYNTGDFKLIISLIPDTFSSLLCHMKDFPMGKKSSTRHLWLNCGSRHGRDSFTNFLFEKLFSISRQITQEWPANFH